jgi:hypothetical protein
MLEVEVEVARTPVELAALAAAEAAPKVVTTSGH